MEKFALVTGKTTAKGSVVLANAPWFGGTRTGSWMHQGEMTSERRIIPWVISDT